MSFLSLGFFPSSVCPIYQPDSSQYGEGTLYPIGYSFNQIMYNYWNIGDINVAVESAAEFTYTTTGCTCAWDASGTGVISRNLIDYTMSSLLCGDGNIYSGTLNLDDDISTCDVFFNYGDMVTDIPILTHADWLAATYYPYILVSSQGDVTCFGMDSCGDFNFQDLNTGEGQAFGSLYFFGPSCGLPCGGNPCAFIAYGGGAGYEETNVVVTPANYLTAA